MLARGVGRVLAQQARCSALTGAWAARGIADGTYFTKDHEYIKIVGGEATVGITHYAQEQLGDVVYVSLPSVGESFQLGAPFASVESVKAASDVMAPVEGKVTEVNNTIVDNPGLVNESPEEKAWFAKFSVSPKADTSHLLSAKAYKAHCEASKH